MNNQRDAVTAVAGAASALAGLVLVFVGFVYARGEAMQNVKRGAQFKNVARAGVLLFVALLGSTWFALNFIQTEVSADYQFAMFIFRASLLLTGLYALAVFWAYL